MSDAGQPISTQCPDEAILEEWAMGRLDAKALNAVEEHIAECDDCARMARRIESEQLTIRVLLDSCGLGPSTECLDDILLARYLDGSLGPETADSVELHLSDCRSCQSRLIELREEVVAVEEGQAIAPLPSEEHGATTLAYLPDSKTEVPLVMVSVRLGLVAAFLVAILGISGALTWPAFGWQFHFLTLSGGALLLRSRQKQVEGFLDAAGDRLVLVSVVLYSGAWILPIVMEWCLLGAILALFAWVSESARRKAKNKTQSSADRGHGASGQADASSEDSRKTG